MPELPEVETVKNGLLPHAKNKTISNTIVRQHSLRWPVPKDLDKILQNKKIKDIKRRAKYLLFYLEDENKSKSGILIIHLGMSGQLRVVNKETELKKHDHVDIILNNNKILRFNDTRRFGAVLWNSDNLEEDPRFNHLGPEPLTDDFNLEYILEKAKNKKTPIKNFIMNNSIVVGVGNIYATEALFYAKISPLKLASNLNKKEWQKLIIQIKKILTKAIDSGGTTLKDFTKADGKPGYFKQELAVYGKAGKPCGKCNYILEAVKQQGRTTVFCGVCQK